MISPTVDEIRAAFEKAAFPKNADPNAIYYKPMAAFIANLPVYIPALLAHIARLEAGREWVKRPTETGWHWMRRSGHDDYQVFYRADMPGWITKDGLSFTMKNYPGAEFQGPLVPSDGVGAKDGLEIC